MKENFLKIIEEKNLNIKNLCLTSKFLGFTTNGNGKYRINVLSYQQTEHGNFTDVTWLFKKYLNLKENKKGDFVLYGDTLDYLKYYLPDLQQIKL